GAAAAARSQESGSGALRFASSGDTGENFGRISGDQACGHGDYGLGVRLRNAADAEPARHAAERATADIRFLIVTPELGDAADDNRVDAQHLTDLRRRRSIRAIAVRKILLRENLVERFPLDNRISAAADQLIHQQVRDSLTDI